MSFNLLLATPAGGTVNLALEEGGAIPAQAEPPSAIFSALNASLSQDTWYVDYVLGTPTGDGSSAHPVDRVATIKSRWQGGLPGTRPQLPAITITVHLVNDAPDASDPLSTLLDVDGAPGAKLIIAGAANAPSHSGTLTTASAFARTAAGGQIAITDGTVADFAPFVGQLLHDVTSGAVCHVYDPRAGASATAKVFRGATPVTPGAVSFSPPTPLTLAGGDAYTLTPLTRATLGAAALVRTAAGVVGFSLFTVALYRIALTDAGFNSLIAHNANVQVQECSLAGFVIPENVDSGTFGFVNCFFNNGIGSSARVARGNVSFFSGGSYGSMFVDPPASPTFDGDFLFTGALATAITCTDGAFVSVGNVGCFSTVNCTYVSQRSQCHLELGPGVSYGTLQGAGLIYSALNNSSVRYHSTGSGTPAADQMQFDVPNFTLGALTSAFSFDTSTGAYVGPTTCTVAHLDAAQGAGTGFGSEAVEPRSCCIFRLI